VCITYSAPARAISRFSGALVGADDDYYEYQACFADQPTVCDIGRVTVRINGSAPFASIAPILSNTNPGGCASGCHLTDQSASGASWTLLGVDLNEQSAVRCAIIKTGIISTFLPPLDAADLGKPLVNLADPSQSLLYRKPQGEDLHGGGNTNLTATELSAILAWIEEGGYNTAGADQSCP
jgi:hypothetical protein